MIVIKEANAPIDCIVLYVLYFVCTTYAAATVTVEACMQCIHPSASAYACRYQGTYYYDDYYLTLLYSTLTCFLQTLISNRRNPVSQSCVIPPFSFLYASMPRASVHHLIRPFLAKFPLPHTPTKNQDEYSKSYSYPRYSVSTPSLLDFTLPKPTTNP